MRLPAQARGYSIGMKIRRLARAAAAAVFGVTAAVMGGAVPSASAQPCPDVDVVFARGTGEVPGVGGVGQAFVDGCAPRFCAAGARS